MEIMVPSHRMVDINGELANKKTNLLFDTEYYELAVIQNSILAERGMFTWGEHCRGGGVTNAWDHPYITSHVNKQ